jgi:hypothetical protein
MINLKGKKKRVRLHSRYRQDLCLCVSMLVSDNIPLLVVCCFSYIPLICFVIRWYDIVIFADFTELASGNLSLIY